MKICCIVCIWIFLAEIRFPSTDGLETHGYSRNNITITCQHSRASTNRKYFCRDPCKERDVLVSSDQTPDGRFSLKDFGNGTFTVTITDLQESDAGIYWCAVDRSIKDTYEKVNLRVSKANTHNITSQSTEFNTTQPLPTSTKQPEFPFATSRKPIRSLTPDDITQSPSMTGLLVWIAVGLTVMLVIFGVILYVYKSKKSSRGSPAADAERGTTLTTEVREREMTDVYEDITDTQQQTDPHTITTVYSAVNHHSAANQIQDSSLYSNLSIQLSDCSDQTAKSNTDTVTYTAVNQNKNDAPQTFPSEDTATYDTVFCS